MQPAAASGVIERTRLALRRSAVRRQLEAVVAGKGNLQGVDLEGAGLDLAALVRQVTAGHRPGSLAHQRLAATFQRSGAADVVVDQLAATDANLRTRSAQLVGELGMEYAVTWLSPLLSAKEPAVQSAAARAMGKLGGTRSADALLRAIRREGPRRTLLVELARAAPDLFLEAALCSQKRTGPRTAVAIAAGLRGRRAAVAPLLALLASGSRRERAASCTALGWIGAKIALPDVAGSLRDPDWKVRLAAVKALVRLGGDAYVVELEALQTDPNPRVQKTARLALRRLINASGRPWEDWAWH
jgi:HEAT repeat protein